MLCGNSNPRLGSREHAAGVQTAAVQKLQHRSASRDTSLVVLWSGLSSWEMPCWLCCWPEPQLSVGRLIPPQSWWWSELLCSGIYSFTSSPLHFSSSREQGACAFLPSWSNDSDGDLFFPYQDLGEPLYHNWIAVSSHTLVQQSKKCWEPECK